MKKIYIIAGEDSGDLHGSNLVKALNKHNPEWEFRGIGGDQMQEQGVSLIAHIKDTNFMGFAEVIKNLKTIRQLFKTTKTDIQNWKPEAVILIDYPGFNLRMAKFIQKLGIKVFYYISPQVWAWKKGRVKTIKRYVDRMMVILPFEKEFYEKEGIEVDFVGHPLLDAIGQSEAKVNMLDKPIIALLPGSRKQEIQRMLPPMINLISRFPDYQFVIAGAPSQEEQFYKDIIGEASVELWMNKTYDLLASASYAVVTSGTATLETALFKVPEVVCYTGSAISYHIGKRLVNIDFISLVNLILGRKAVEELIQYDYTSERVEQELRRLMKEEELSSLLDDYKELRSKLGNEGASERAAQVIMQQMQLTATA